MENNPETDPTPSAEAAPTEAAEPSSTETPAAAEQQSPPAAEEPPQDAEAPAQDDAAEPAPAPADDPLSLLVAESQKRRLPPADEERAAKLLGETLLNGREGVGQAIEHLPKLPWIIGVNAVTAVWQEMKPTFRTRLSAGLARVDSEAARRVRLSLARGLFKQDAPAALKITVSVVKDMREKEPGTITPKNAQIFANVFIGRAKPWVTQLPLAELKPAEADLLVQTALLAAFTVPHPPATQLGLLKWAVEGGRLAGTSEPVLAAIVKVVERWSGKWRGALRREVAELPEPIAAVVKVETPEPAAREEGAPAREGDEERAETAEPKERADDDEEDDDEDEDDKNEEKEEAPRAPRPRPVYESKTVPRRENQRSERPDRAERPDRPERADRPEPRSFDLPAALRQIDHYVSGLRHELQQAQNKLRQRDGGRREVPERPSAIPGAPTPDELARLNQQLEARNAELQSRIDEMREDAETRAASAGEAPEDAAAQLRTLLAFKLQEDFADFLALETEAPDLVIKQHYPVLLRHVFEVLQGEGVKLEKPSQTEVSP